MPALFVFLLKVNIALLLFCAGYYLVLRHLTFYTLNRIYLVAAILFATMYPQINLDGFAQRHQQLTQPVQVVISNLRAPAVILVKPLAQPVYWHWVEIVFFAGAAFLAMRLLTQLFSLYRLHRHSMPMRIRGHDVRVIHGDGGPFSFWKSIYINPAKHGDNDLKAILKHEQIHVDEWHTLDVLLAEISTVFYWFNPGIWFMKKAVRENIEFITDRKILKNGADSKQYQYSLVNVSFAAAPQSIVNHFNLSTIKKRIIMMNAKQSSKVNLTRYAFLVPAVIICLLTFSFSKAEFVKKSKSTYKAITLSVDKITNIATENPGAKFVANLFKKDTIKIIKRSNKDTLVLISHGINDTGKRNVRLVYNYSFSNDTGHADKIKLFAQTFDFRSNNDSNRIRKVRINGHDMKADSIVYIVNGVKASGLKSLTADDIQHIEVMKSDRANSDQVIVVSGYSTDHKTVHPDGITANQKVEMILTKPQMTNIRINGKGMRDTVIYKHGDVTINGSNRAFGRINETNIENLSTKLIFIDGKEATERDLKKLSAADIKSMSAKSGEEVTKQYGDKAKDGVLFITTKK